MIVKKYACHRLYDASDHYYPQSVVTIDEDGKVIECHPLTEETSATEWIGGIIILSDKAEIPPFTDFQALLRLLTETNRSRIYAWHLSAFDFQQECLTSQSVLTLLH